MDLRMVAGRRHWGQCAVDMAAASGRDGVMNGGQDRCDFAARSSSITRRVRP